MRTSTSPELAREDGGRPQRRRRDGRRRETLPRRAPPATPRSSRRGARRARSPSGGFYSAPGARPRCAPVLAKCPPLQTAPRAARVTVERMDAVERFRTRYSFPLDDFQIEAIRAIE